jgi:hypothetical protein
MLPPAFSCHVDAQSLVEQAAGDAVNRAGALMWPPAIDLYRAQPHDTHLSIDGSRSGVEPKAPTVNQGWLGAPDAALSLR